MAKNVRIINTGQTLGKNIFVKEDKIVPVGNADIRPSGSPIPAPVLGGVAPRPPISTENISQQPLPQPKIYFVTPSRGVELHRDEFGQTWLSMRATPTITMVSLVIFGAVCIAVLVKFFRLYLEGRASLNILDSSSNEVMPVVTQAQVRRIRRLSL